MGTYDAVLAVGEAGGASLLRRLGHRRVIAGVEHDEVVAEAVPAHEDSAMHARPRPNDAGGWSGRARAGCRVDWGGAGREAHIFLKGISIFAMSLRPMKVSVRS